MQPWLRERNPCVLHCLRPSSLLKQCVRSREHSGAHTHGPIEDSRKPRPAHLLAVHPGSVADLQVDHFFDAWVADAAFPPHPASVALHLCLHPLPRDNVPPHAGLCQRRRWRRRGDALPSCAQLIGRDAGRDTCPAFCTLAGAPSVSAQRRRRSARQDAPSWRGWHSSGREWK